MTKNYELLLVPYDTESSADYKTISVIENKIFEVPAHFRCGVLSGVGDEDIELSPAIYEINNGEIERVQWQGCNITPFNQNGIRGEKIGDKWAFVNMEGEIVSDERFDDITGPWQGEYSGYFSIADSRLGCGRGTANPSGNMIIPPHYDTMPIPIGNGMFTTLLNNEPVMINQFQLLDNYENNTKKS